MPPALSSNSVIGVVPAVSAARLATLSREGFPRVIDLRSEAEFADDHLPLAQNVPLFDEEERALVGLLYAKRSPDAAFRAGRAIVIEKIGELVARIGAIAGWEPCQEEARERVREWTAGGIAQLERSLEVAPIDELPERALVLGCWRGGLRSRSVAALLRSLGHPEVVVLDGGYRAWRRIVLGGLESWRSPRAFVLRGLTGVGKTLVLREIERLVPGATIDLEEAAGHRSSLLGMVGLEPCSQKTFESRLFDRIRRGFGPWVVFEGESRKVGDAIIPRTFWDALDRGTNVELVASRERRVRVLLDDYLADPSGRPALRNQLGQLSARMPRRFPLQELLDSGREHEIVTLVLEHYYDPLYRRSEADRSYACTFDATDPAQAARAIIEWIESSAAPRRDQSARIASTTSSG